MARRRNGPWERLQRAASDRSSGSAVVARDAAAAIAELDPAQVDEALRVLVRGQPFMATCLRLVDNVLRASDPARAARAFAARLEREASAAPGSLRPLLPRRGTILTVSASSAVTRALARLGRHTPNVVCALSEPGGEGRAAAAELEEAGLDVEIIPDAAVASRAASVDLVVFGADAVAPGGVLNKTGTLAAVLGARHARRDRICVCGTSKFVDRRGWEAIVGAASGRRGAVSGSVPVPLFESIPLRLITTVLTEDGPLQPQAAARLAASSTLDRRTLELLREAT